MRAQSGMAWGVLGAVVLLQAACQDFQPSKRSSFKGKYQVSRQALEEGRYARAIRGYQDLLQQAGPFAPRVRLEYAHALLRDNRYLEAAREARIVAETQKGDARLAALAVQGTAEHEMARAAMAAGQRGPAVRARLKSAQKALKAVLKKRKVFDPLGSLARRHKIISSELKTL